MVDYDDFKNQELKKVLFFLDGIKSINEEHLFKILKIINNKNIINPKENFNIDISNIKNWNKDEYGKIPLYFTIQNNKLIVSTSVFDNVINNTDIETNKLVLSLPDDFIKEIKLDIKQNLYFLLEYFYDNAKKLSKEEFQEEITKCYSIYLLID